MLVALAVGGWFLAASIFRIETPQGTLVVEIPKEAAETVQVSIRQGGSQVELLDLKSKKQVTLNAGKYQLELIGGKDGLKLETNQFELKRGEQRVARVTFQPRLSKLPSSEFRPEVHRLPMSRKHGSSRSPV